MLKRLTVILKKISFFDAFLLSILLVLGTGFFFFFYRRAEYIKVRVRVTDQDVLYANNIPRNWYAQHFYAGDYELDALGKKVTEVLKVERFSITNERDVVFLDLNLKATYDTRTKMYSARGKQIMYGAPMKFNLQKVTFDGIITEFPGSDMSQKAQEGEITVRTLSRGIEPMVAKTIKMGDVVTDYNGVILAEVLKVDVKQAERVATTSKGDLLLRYDPIYKDVYLTLKLKVRVVNGESLMFDSVRVKVDQPVPLNFKNISLFPTLIEIVE